jgi:membrane associated rhomboid family serine protease
MMLACPNCSQRLARRVTETGVIYACPGCGGVATGLATLRNEHIASEFVGGAWQAAQQDAVPQGRPCPHCGRKMATIPADTGGTTVELDVCKLCASVWLDPGERAALPRVPPPPPPETDISPEARHAVAMAQVDEIRRQDEESSGQKAPDENWQWLPALLGFPVECGVPAVGTQPWVTWGATALCVIVFAGALAMGGVAALVGMFQTWGFIPSEWYRLGGATVVSSFFLHAGGWHLVGNMYFLVVFGDNVEDQLGWRRFALLLLLAHVAGIITHGVFEPRSSMPLVGASLGVSGVIAYYAVAFPKARLGMFFFFLFWMRLPAYVWLVLWGILQLLLARSQLAGTTNVSALGHLGGAAVGFVAALVVRRRRRQALDLAGARRGRYDRSSAGKHDRRPRTLNREDDE